MARLRGNLIQLIGELKKICKKIANWWLPPCPTCGGKNFLYRGTLCVPCFSKALYEGKLEAKRLAKEERIEEIKEAILRANKEINK